MKHAPQTDYVNVSSVSDEPLWVERRRVLAIGVHGKGSLVVMEGGVQLVAKGTHPNEAVQIVSGVDSAED